MRFQFRRLFLGQFAVPWNCFNGDDHIVQFFALKTMQHETKITFHYVVVFRPDTAARNLKKSHARSCTSERNFTLILKRPGKEPRSWTRLQRCRFSRLTKGSVFSALEVIWNRVETPLTRRGMSNGHRLVQSLKVPLFWVFVKKISGHQRFASFSGILSCFFSGPTSANSKPLHQPMKHSAVFSWLRSSPCFYWIVCV